MEPEQRGRASRASSTSSLGREVRCGCQYYQSDSLLPERRALIARPSSRTMQQPPAVRCSEHEYEPIAAPSPSPKPPTAPVVRITDTDVVRVADSDDSIDDRARLPLELTRAGDVVLPLDGKIEDSAMEGRELVEAGDTSEELETPQELQDRLEERFLSVATPGTGSRTDGEVNTSQVDSLALEELPLRRGARGLPQRLKSQAGKLRTRLRNIQRPSFAFADRQKPEKTRSTSSGRSDRSRSEKRPSRMERIRSSLPDRPKISLPSRPKFNFPDRSKFHLPERPKFSLPEKPKFNIKKPNIRLPNALTRSKKQPKEQESTDSTVGSRRNIFDFSTYPRIFDRKSKNKPDYATSTPKDSRAQSAEISTFPRSRKGWAQRFEETAYIDEDRPEAVTTVERSRPWRHPSLEEPRLSIRMEDEVRAAMPWEEKRNREEDLQFMDYELESPESSERHPIRSTEASRTEEESYDREELDPRLYGVQGDRQDVQGGSQKTWHEEEMTVAHEDIPKPIQRARSLGDEGLRADVKDTYEESFPAVDPRRRFVPGKMPSEEEEEEYEEELEPSSAQSDREQQHSSGSSCDRRRRGIIEEMDSDEFFLRASGLSHDDVNLGKYLTEEIREALRAEMDNALADDQKGMPPERPIRKRSLRKRREDSVESYDLIPPARPARSRRSESADDFRERTRSDSRHRVVYQAEGSPREITPAEPLDDIVVVKPQRRKSRGSTQRSQSQVSLEPRSSSPPVVPQRRKRSRRATPIARSNGDFGLICNGHSEWPAPEKPLPSPPSMPDDLPDEQEVLTAEDILATSREDIRQLLTRLRDEEYVEPVPVPPKRRSRSRGTSVAQDDDRTSHGAESLPEAGYVEEDIPPDELEFGRDLAGYAIIDKREKPPRPPPPRRRKEKFATTPRQTGPKRPVRGYSTLGPAKSRDTSILSETISTTLEPAKPYFEVDSDDGEHKDLRSGEILSKMQRRPLPAPPRPPRARKDRLSERTSTQELSMESTIATQTDPLPDDMIIEEEITQAKLVVAPSRTGSQVLVSTERIPSPSMMATPPVPPLPTSQRLHRDEQMTPSFDTVSLKAPSPIREHESSEDRHLSAPHLGERHREEEARVPIRFSDEPVRISNLEVGDLRVDRLSVSQIDASKIVASEVEALLITASELKSMSGSLEDSLSPSIIRELIAIRSHLETVAASRETTRPPVETKTDIPDTRSVVEEEARASSTEDEDQKVVTREVVKTKDKEIPITRTLSVAQVEEIPVTRTLVAPKESPLSEKVLIQSTQDKSLRILESPLSLSSTTAKEIRVEESHASLTPTTPKEITESRLPSEDDQLQEPTESKTPPEFSSLASERLEKESSPDSGENKGRKSRSRSSSPGKGILRVRQTASPVRSLPPVISVTPDTPDVAPGHGVVNETQPQRAIISYSTEQSDRDSQRELSQSPMLSFPLGGTHFIAFPASQIPAQLISLTGDTSQRTDSDPSVLDTTRHLVRALKVAGVRAMRHFVGYLSSITSGEESTEKIRELELTLCALLLLVAGLLIFFFGTSRTITYHHHWDYFNPPQ